MKERKRSNLKVPKNDKKGSFFCCSLNFNHSNNTRLTSINNGQQGSVQQNSKTKQQITIEKNHKSPANKTNSGQKCLL